MEPINLSSAQKSPKIGKAKHVRRNATNISNVKFANSPEAKISSETTYNNSLSLRRREDSDLENNIINKGSGLKSNLILGNYKQKMKSEAKDKFIAKRFSVDNGKRIKEMMDRMKSKLFMKNLNISKLSSNGHFQTTHQAMNSTLMNIDDREKFNRSTSNRVNSLS